ncbi:MAG TPA: HD domain-containing phosphohydrolase [Bryobacteraceae bacterium]|nr:HD domain-containing phosphohydrolase [Bryobacteraceae bacterium]
MKHLRQMTRHARAYALVLLALAVCLHVAAYAHWHPPDLLKFSAIFCMAVAASVLRVLMPQMAGEVSFSLMFVLIGIVDLSLPETLLLGCSTLVIESIWRPGSRLTASQVFFAIANLSVAIGVAQWVFDADLFAATRARLPLRILAAAATCFAMNSFAVAAFMCLSERAPLFGLWRERARRRLWPYVLAAVVAWAYTLIANRFGWVSGILLLPCLYLLQRTYSLYIGRLEDARGHAEEVASLHLRTIEALAGAIEAKDDNTHSHLKRVQVYAIEIGRELGLDEHELAALRIASVLHDIGKLAVPESIISKPGRLTPEEFEKMKVHPIVGAEILERVRFPYPVVPIVRAHHEKWDGKGYPYGLLGEEIPIGARILSAVDALDALASDRQYRRALPLSEAMAKIAAESGTSFDPKVVAILKRRYVELERKARTESQAAPAPKLSIDMKVSKDAAPGAGFETASPVRLPARPQADSLGVQALLEARRDVQDIFEAALPGGGAFDLAESLSLLAVRVRRFINYDSFAVYFVRDGELVPEFVVGEDYRLFRSLRIPMGQGLAGWVAENRQSILNGNPSVEPGYLNDPNLFSTMRSALAVPLEATAGVLGVLSFYREARDGFSIEEQLLAEALAPRIAMAIEEAASSCPQLESVETSGFPDTAALLGHLEAEMARAQRLRLPLSVLVCQVNGLRRIRETSGAPDAAKALRAIAIGLRDSCREFEFLARIGPAEFAIVAPGLTAHATDSRIARIGQIVSGHGSHPATISSGAAHFPDDGETAMDLLRAADRHLVANLRARRRQTEPAAAAR